MVSHYIRAINNVLESSKLKIGKVLESTDVLPQVLWPDFSITYDSIKRGSPVQELTATIHIIDNHTSTERVDNVLNVLKSLHQNVSQLNVPFNILTFEIMSISGTIVSERREILYSVSISSKFNE